MGDLVGFLVRFLSLRWVGGGRARLSGVSSFRRVLGWE